MRRYFGINITLWLIIVNMVVFVLVHAVPGLDDLLELKAQTTLHGGHLWGLFTSMFTHIEPWHVFMNMIALFFIGQYLESILETKRFLATYLVGGLVGGIFFILWNGVILGQYVSCVGASGALFGMLAALAVLTLRERYVTFATIK